MLLRTIQRCSSQRWFSFDRYFLRTWSSLQWLLFLLFSVMQTERGRRIGHAVAETGKAVGMSTWPKHQETAQIILVCCENGFHVYRVMVFSSLVFVSQAELSTAHAHSWRHGCQSWRNRHQNRMKRRLTTIKNRKRKMWRQIVKKILLNYEAQTL